MAQTIPLCFSSRTTWRQWLEESWRVTLHDKAARNAMTRGVVPPYCADCGSKYRTLMDKQGRCSPPAGASPPPLLVEPEKTQKEQGNAATA